MDQAAAEAILQRLPVITEHQTRMLHAIWEGGDAVTRQRAWQRGKRALSAQRGEALYEIANGAVSRWIRDWASGRVGMPYEVYSSFLDQNRLETRIAAAPPILDAILASLVPDAFPQDELEELMGPWTLAVLGDGATDDPIEPDHDDKTDTRGDTQP